MTAHAQPLPRSAPEAQGIPSPAILDFVRAAEETVEHLHSFMLLRHGHRVAAGWWEPYTPERTHVLFSLSKSFTSTAVGLAVAEGHFSVDDKVISFFPDDLPEQVSDNLAAMRVWDLLTMSTGHLQDTTGTLRGGPDDNWVRAFLAQPVGHEPGAPFLYNSGATYMLSAIVQTVTGSTVLDYLRPRLLDPLGIGPAKWDSCPRGINVGGWGLHLRTEDIARFGQLYLQKGEWQGQQLVPAEWIEAATSAQVDNSTRVDDGSVDPDWGQGYGYQFWRCRHNAYRGDGAFGQYCIVMPEQDAVLAITSGLRDMQAVLDLIWEHLLPAMNHEPLPLNESAHAELSDTLDALTLPVVRGEYTSPVMARISGRRYVFDRDVPATPADSGRPAVRAVQNTDSVEAVALDFQNDGCTFIIKDAQGEHRIACGHGGWQEGMTTWHSDQAWPVAASGAWTSPDTYQMRIYFTASPFCAHVTCRFEENRIIYHSGVNVSFGPLENPERVGRMG